VRVKDNKMRDGFRRDIELVELVQERIGDRTDPTLDDGVGFSSNEIKVKKFASEEGDVFSDLEWEKHESKLTHPEGGFKGLSLPAGMQGFQGSSGIPKTEGSRNPGCKWSNRIVKLKEYYEKIYCHANPRTLESLNPAFINACVRRCGDD
jgi:hypothetical protein